MTAKPKSLSLADYLMSDDVVDWNHPAVANLSAELTCGITADIDRARILYTWVRDSIPHSADAGREEVTCSASEVLQTGTGICYAKAHLLAALLRAVGIPAGFCYQVFLNEDAPEAGTMALHGLNGVYLSSLDRWVRVDSRGNKPGVDAEFDIHVERIAFPDDAYLDEWIYPEPLPTVVTALRTAHTRSELWPILPKAD